MSFCLWSGVQCCDIMSKHQIRDTYYLNSEIISTDAVRNAGFLVEMLGMVLFEKSHQQPKIVP